MMNEQQYFEYIKKMVIESLDVQYDEIISNKSELEQEDKYIIITLLANPPLINNIVYNLNIWSYNQAELNNFQKTPRMASYFLSHAIVRQYTLQYVKMLNQQKPQDEYNQQTR